MGASCGKPHQSGQGGGASEEAAGNDRVREGYGGGSQSSFCLSLFFWLESSCKS